MTEKRKVGRPVGMRLSDRQKAALSEAAKRPEVWEKRRLGIQACWSSPERRARIIEGMRRTKARPEYRAHMSSVVASAWADPAEKQRRTDAIRRGFARKALKLAGLPLTKGLVDRARALMDGGQSMEEAGETLRKGMARVVA